VNRTLITLAATAALVAIPATANAYSRPKPKPAAVTVTGQETCTNGYITVDGTLTATRPGTYDVAFTGGLASYQAEQYVGTFTLAAGGSASYSFALGSGQQVDVIVYDDTTGMRVASREVAAASVCGHSW
jgi:hypothetical protein